MYRTPYKHQTGNCNEQAMRGSPYAKPLEAVVVEWSNKLVYMQVCVRMRVCVRVCVSLSLWVCVCVCVCACVCPLEAVVVEWSNKLVYMQAPPTPLESITPSS